jgi:hypothetical protein
MDPERDNFEPLRRLLALKKYEQPPPGYFSRFSQQVLLRIEHGEGVKEVSAFDWLLSPLSWLQRSWDALESRPALAGCLGFAVCAVLASGFYFSDGTPHMASVVTVDSPLGAASFASAQPATNGIMRVRGSSLFDEYRRGDVAPRSHFVNWQLGH